MDTMTQDIKPIQDSYNAVGIAEGFVEESNPRRVIMAWSYIGTHKLHHNLQGFFGRTLHSLVENSLLNPDYSVNWDEVEERLDAEDF
jgi:hypothetical protein